ncbi:hypothetical protein TNCV_2610931 [Trichonephila clavipes]|nr:hypothetical protein TNCV_2610931 [Trichonephila clavipes]
MKMRVLSRSRQNDRLRVMLVLVHIAITPPHSPLPVFWRITERTMRYSWQVFEMCLHFKVAYGVTESMGSWSRTRGWSCRVRVTLKTCQVEEKMQFKSVVNQSFLASVMKKLGEKDVYSDGSLSLNTRTSVGVNWTADPV